MKYYAHSTSDLTKANWQLLQDHLIAVGKLAELAAQAFGCGQLAKAIGLLHDLGKLNHRRQRRLSLSKPD